MNENDIYKLIQYRNKGLNVKMKIGKNDEILAKISIFFQAQA